MNATRLDKDDGRRTGKAADPDTALFVTVLAFGLAMLSLFAVLAFANVVPLGDVAPFFAVPVLLFVTSGVFFLNWSRAEAHEEAVAEAAHRSSMRAPTRGRAIPEPAPPKRQMLKSTAAAGR